MRRVFTTLSRVLLYAGLLLAWVQPAQADSRLVITAPTDFNFEFAEPTQFLAQTYQSGDLPSDPQLWLYNSDNELIVTNDDYVGLQSKIDLMLSAGSYRLRASTCCYEPDVWRDGVVWNIQYELTFNESQSDSTTTEVPKTTTTELATTTTTLLSTTTTSQPSTDIPSSTSTSSTTTSLVNFTTTDAPTTTTTTEPATTTTTTEPATITTVIQTTTTSEVTTSLPAEVSTTTTQVELPTTTQSNGTQPSTISPTTSTTSSTSTTVPTTTSTSSTSTSTTTPESTLGTTTEPTTAPTTSAPVTESTLVESLPAEAEEIVAYLEDLTTDDLADLTETQTEELIASIADADLTDEQAQQIAEALSDAPTEVKQEFEQTINVFSGQFDTYVPDGSTISVGARRAVVAVTAVSFMLPAPVPTTRRRI